MSSPSNTSLSVLVPPAEPFENTGSMVEMLGDVASVVPMDGIKILWERYQNSS